MMDFHVLDQLRHALLRQHMIRPLDMQFGEFVATQYQHMLDLHTPSETGDNTVAKQHQAMRAQVCWLATLVSHELGQGHICCRLFGADEQLDRERLGFGLSWQRLRALWMSQLPHLQENSLDLDIDSISSPLDAVDWRAVITQCPLINVDVHHSPDLHQPSAQQVHNLPKHHVTEVRLPLVFDGQRLYLQRYWHDEMQLAHWLHQRAQPLPLNAVMMHDYQQRLSHLFVRETTGLAQKLSLADSTESARRIVCEHWDVTFPERLNWPAIDEVIQQGTCDDDLNALLTLIPESVCLNWQKVAAAVAMTRRLAVISGGPGTGKTTTVTKLLAAWIMHQQLSSTSPIIQLVAPTGKAAARLTESMVKAVAQLSCDESVRQFMPTQASTIHRLLGAIPDSAAFRHHQQNRLHVDLLVVDEASMVDLPLMYKLFAALPEHTHVILLGDRDQLASVEAGAVLGDLCDFSSQGYSQIQQTTLSVLTGYACFQEHLRSQEALDQSAPISPIADCLCLLQKSYRFRADSGIGQLAKAVNQGKFDEVIRICQSGYDDIAVWSLDSHQYHQLLSTMVEGYRPYLSAIQCAAVTDRQAHAKEVLSLFAQCRLLCAVREGDFGVVGVNQRIEKSLARHQLIQLHEGGWYEGRPVMVTQNDHQLGIYNGDIGICLRDAPGEHGRFKVYFELSDGRIHGVLPSRMPQHETAYAMTIHKSQGSEFETTVMLLPAEDSPLLTRELVYTGITRAKRSLKIYTHQHILKRAVQTPTIRMSGLREQILKRDQ